MIKKPVFENDLITGMQHELRKQASADLPNLVKAGECLHAAMEILEETGLQSRADQVLGILHKIAIPTKHIQQVPTLQKLQEYGLTAKDLQDFGKGVEGAKYKLNAVLRAMGWEDHQIVQFIGKHNVVPKEALLPYERITKMIEEPTLPQLPSELGAEEQTPEEISKLEFESIAARPGKPRKPKRPDTVYPGSPHNGHVKNLTPQRMIENLMNHGTVFNMSDDGGIDVSNANFDPEMAEALGVNNANDYLEVDDILNADVIDDTLEVSDLVPLEDFEDEVHTANDSASAEHTTLDKLVKFVKEHGHHAHSHDGKLLVKETGSSEEIELSPTIKAVRHWLGY